ncbi:LysR family transcriptional regulator [Vibrio mangrovi]|uniref:HTH-type transcriptional regulator GltC n=1 Tax=Vibrio mangrovi TaxID=474394 RepID=A0A1Y6IQG8_9VIBR|nr:LysR family transcriptional regulator [Vibrio mangrovi]MDW6003905.1 LysR family transcriptional regulator [Vibrio mangrovi]SMR99301.1 HTH-type transcriptional regulator GltC [Vibrio mangrovi]
MAAIHHLTAPALRYFLEVARSGSIREASTHLNVATSAISRQISNLENLLGTSLFERRPRGMVLSASGELLAAYARKVLLETDRILGEIESLEGLQRGKVVLASTEGFAMEFLPLCIGQYQEKFKGIQFQIDVRSPGGVSESIRNGEADIGLTFSIQPSQEIKVVHTQPAPIMAIVPPGHPLSEKKKVSLTQITAYPLALPHADTTVRQLFDICTSQQQLRYEPALISSYMSALNQFTISGAGISLSGEISVRRLIQSGFVKAIPITDRGMGIRNTEVQVLTGRTLPKAVSSFLDYLITQIQTEPQI